MRSLNSLLRELDVRFSAALLAVPLVACGSGEDTKDASADVFTGCNPYMQNCCPPPTTITYAACTMDASAEGGDASPEGGDASPEGGDADASSGAEGGACFATCMEACQAQGISGFCTEQGTDGGLHVAQCSRGCGVGRRPEGLRDEDGENSAAALGLGCHFAHAAWMEAASVRAFDRMTRELEAHGAPKVLIRAAKRAARDEVRHARAMARLARAYGSRVPRVRVRSGRVRSLERIAHENAVEGCVGETFGALVLRWQAEHTTLASLETALRRIARDEARHAALSLAVDAWILPRLRPTARARIAEARQNAERRIASGIRASDRSSDRRLGLPDRTCAEALAGALFSPKG